VLRHFQGFPPNGKKMPVRQPPTCARIPEFLEAPKRGRALACRKCRTSEAGDLNRY
jgi:hypothetical protein